MKISIITATLNNEKTIKDTLTSVANQSYKNIEHIIIDGKSTDNTLSIVKKFQHVSKIISEKDKGIYFALNKGIDIATGDIIGFLHADDYFAYNEVAENIARLFIEGAEIVYANLDYISFGNDKIIRHWTSGDFNLKKLKRGWMPPHPTFYAKKDLFLKFGNFNTNFKISADYDLMTRFLKNATEIKYLPKVIVKMRIGGKSNNSLKHILQKSAEDLKSMRKNQIGGIATLFLKNFRKINQFFQR